MQYIFGDFQLNAETLVLSKNGEEIDLETRAVKLLVLLIQAWPEHCDAKQLLSTLWPKTVVSNWSVSRLVSDCRKELKKCGYSAECIQTLHGRGYRLASTLANEIFNQQVQKDTEYFNKFVHAKKSVLALTLVGFCSAFLWFPTKKTIVQNGPMLRIAEAPDTRARILWVDDHPQNNIDEIEFFKQEKIAVYKVSSTDDAMLLLSLYKYDAVISDLGRHDDPLAGFRLLQKMRETNIETAFYLYTLLSSDEQARLVKEYGGQGVATTPEQLYKQLIPATLMTISK